MSVSPYFLSCCSLPFDQLIACRIAVGVAAPSVGGTDGSQGSVRELDVDRAV